MSLTLACARSVPLLPKLRGQFAEFLRSSSLKRLGILYLTTCVGFGYGLCWGYFLEQLGCARTPTASHNFRHSSHTRWRTNIHVLPIDYAFRPRLRGRLTLLRLTLSRNPWSFGEGVSHSLYRYSCQHSHFRYLQGPSQVPLHWLTERSATTWTSPHPQLRCMALAPLHFRRKDP